MKTLSETFKFQILLMILIFAGLGCTTQMSSSDKLSLSIPTTGALSGNQLEHVIINIRTSTDMTLLPKVYECGGPDTSCASGGNTAVIEVFNPPQGSEVLVQFLGVFKDSTGLQTFHYADNLNNLASIGGGYNEVVLNVDSATGVMASTKEGHVFGRYLTAADTGPTGKMIGYFDPPGGSPKMAVFLEEMFNGWFHVMLPGETIPITWETFDGTVIFAGMQMGVAPLDTFANHRFRAEVPTRYEWDADEGMGEVEVYPPADFFMGFYGPASSAGQVVCWTPDQETLSGVFEEPALVTPIRYTAASGVNTNLKHAGGVSTSHENMIANCTHHPSTPEDYMTFWPQLLSDHIDSLSGTEGPFQQVRPYRPLHSSFIDMQFDGSSSITAKWMYLPSANTGANGIDVSVYGKYNPTGMSGDFGGFEDEHAPCDAVLQSKGFFHMVDKAGTDPADFTFNNVAGFTVNSSNTHAFEVAVCPYKDIAGNREYFSSYIRSGCSGDCIEPFYFGNGVSPGNWNGVGNVASGAKINSMTSVVDGVTTFNVVNAYGGAIVPGDELLIHVVSDGNPSGAGCGTYNGHTIKPGDFTFTRLLDVSGTTLKIPSGTFVDDLNSAQLGLGTFAPTSDFCWVHAVKVENFDSLSVSSTGGAMVQAFDIAGGGGGVIAVRVNGTLTIDDQIEANFDGFAGGLTYNYGGGIEGESGSGDTATGGQGDSGAAGGGAGYGAGADGFLGGTGGVGTQGNDHMGINIQFGSGGGAGTSGPAGAGGGIIFVAAREINVVGGGAIVTANGGNGSDGGGGGGGSINIITERIYGSPNLMVAANGGNGSNTNTGVGGGGYAKVYACNQVANNFLVLNNFGSVLGSNINAEHGNSDKIAPADQSPICEDSQFTQ